MEHHSNLHSNLEGEYQGIADLSSSLRSKYELYIRLNVDPGEKQVLVVPFDDRLMCLSVLAGSSLSVA